MTDSITTLRALDGKCLAKRRTLGEDGEIQIRDYDRAYLFDLASVPLASLDDLETLLTTLAGRASSCVVRGAIADPERTKRVRRAFLIQSDGYAPTLVEAPHQWLAMDIENIAMPEGVAYSDLEGCARHAFTFLPEAFQGAAVIVQATGSHGFKPDMRLRLWFWLDTRLSGDQVTRWLGALPGQDPQAFLPAQCLYTSRPLFYGIVDPIPNRMIRLPGVDRVLVPAEVVAPIPAAAGKRAWRALVAHTRTITPAKAERWTHMETQRPLLKDAEVRDWVHTVAVPPEIAFRLRGIDMVMRQAKKTLTAAAEAGHCRAALYNQAMWLGHFFHTGLIEEDAAARYLLRHSLPRAVDYLDVIENGFAAGRAEPRELQAKPKPDISRLLRKAG